MIVFKMFDGEVLKFNFSNPQKEKELFEFWKSFMNKKIKLKSQNEDKEIKLVDIEECLIEEDAKKFLEEDSQENIFTDNNGSLNFFKDIFKI